MNDSNAVTLTERVYRRLEEAMRVPGVGEFDGHVWLAILIPILVAGLFYVGWQYLRDGRAIGWYWATFLGLLRCTVYGVLALVFLLPARQSYDVVNRQSRVILAVDVTGSMQEVRDGQPAPGQRVEDMPTRMDLVNKVLTDDKVAFVRRLYEKNPIFAYRFGRFLDENYQVIDDAKTWTRGEWEERQKASDPSAGPEGRELTPSLWTAWLRPDYKEEPKQGETEDYRKERERIRQLGTSTNPGDSILAVLNREINNMVQGIVVFTDGRATEGESTAYRELALRATKAGVPIFVVSVGEDRPPVRIEIAEVRVPEQARPDDPFKVSVQVNGEGLPDEDVTVNLDLYKPGPDGLPQKEKTPIEPKKVKFSPSLPPHTEAEFEITPAAFGDTEGGDDKGDKTAKKPEFAEGKWKFVARVAKDRREAFLPAEHVSDPAEVNVVKRPLRILLFASAATRDYQFVRTLLVREIERKRVEMSIYLQPAPGRAEPRLGVVQDIEPERLLSTFPTLLTDDAEVKDPKDRYYNLGAYDLIIGFDPDWSVLSQEQIKNVYTWVQNGGGLVVVAGNVNTLELARPGTKPGAEREKLKPILDLYPVLLKDARIQQLDRDTKEPWRLNFPGASPDLEFLRLNEDEKAPLLAGWEEFFTGAKEGVEPKGVIRGFYNFYPVEAAKPTATVVATFSDPQVRLQPDNKEHPFLVAMQNGAGKVVWLGSGETWRLREVNEAYHERFWTKLARYTGSGNLKKVNQRIDLLLSQFWKVNDYVQVEAKIRGRDLKPLPKTAKVFVEISVPGVSQDVLPNRGRHELTARPGGGETRSEGPDWDGRFLGRFLVKTPGEYKVELKVPETNDSYNGKFIVKEANPEIDNTRPDFELMYELASDAEPVLNRVADPAVKEELKRRLTRTRPAEQAGTEKSAAHDSANANRMKLVFGLKDVDLIPQCMLADRKTNQNRGQVVDLWDDGFTLREAESPKDRPLKLSYVLCAVVGLLSVEWLTRKLLRLA